MANLLLITSLAVFRPRFLFVHGMRPRPRAPCPEGHGHARVPDSGALASPRFPPPAPRARPEAPAPGAQIWVVPPFFRRSLDDFSSKVFGRFRVFVGGFRGPLEAPGGSPEAPGDFRFFVDFSSIFDLWSSILQAPPKKHSSLETSEIWVLPPPSWPDRPAGTCFPVPLSPRRSSQAAQHGVLSRDPVEHEQLVSIVRRPGSFFEHALT